MCFGLANKRFDQTERPFKALSSLEGMLKTKHGRTFATMPRSTSHTSPRVGIVAIGFLGIQRLEDFVRQSNQLIV